MNTAEDMENRPAESASGVTSHTETPMDVATAIDQLRSLVCGLGACLLVVSLALTAFIYKQNRNLVAGTLVHERQIARLQAEERSVNYLVNALVQYSSGKPELMALLARHGLQVAPPPASKQPAAR